MNLRAAALIVIAGTASLFIFTGAASANDVFRDTRPLRWEGDIASRMIDQLDQFLLKQTSRISGEREATWQREYSVDNAAWRAARRRNLKKIIGVRDQRPNPARVEFVSAPDESALVAVGQTYRIFAIRWRVVRDVWFAGLLLEPDRPARGNVVAVPDPAHTPEMICGLEAGLTPPAQYARRLAEAGIRVIVPRTFSRRAEPRNGRATMTDREYVYRITYELGRHPVGYEVQSVLALVDWFYRTGQTTIPCGVIGWGQGGLTALHAAALDNRIQATGVSGYLGDRRVMWREPIDRNLFGYLTWFGDAEVAALVAPRSLVVESAAAPAFEFAPGQGGAPGKLVSPAPEEVSAEVERAKRLTKQTAWIAQYPAKPGVPCWSDTALAAFIKRLTGDDVTWSGNILPKLRRPLPDRDALRASLLHAMEQESAWLLRESPYVRQEFWKDADTSSLEAYDKTTRRYRDYLRHEVVGHFALPLLKPSPQTRRKYDRPKWTGYEVVLDVFPDVFAYGILLWPKNIRPGEKRPVVVCQHGLEGRPTDTIEGDHRAYHDFAAKLANEGFIVFAPQNCYIFGDRFRTLQRKANPLKKTLFSLIVPQHQQITNWLASLPEVDASRIGFYGLSYGGKSAMRIPPLVDRYCLSICSADFNEWIWKNVSTRDRYSYVWTGEYEIFEFDLGSTFNYAELAGLIAPRPFMVERGHFDGVAPDETVAYEYAKVRRLYAAQLKIPDRTAIEWFAGPHTINGRGTFEFLRKHLRFPAGAAR